MGLNLDIKTAAEQSAETHYEVWGELGIQAMIPFRFIMVHLITSRAAGPILNFELNQQINQSEIIF